MPRRQRRHLRATLASVALSQLVPTGPGGQGRPRWVPVSEWPRVAVVGGSLGGLTAALVLRDLGCEVDVFERSTAHPEEDGATGIPRPSRSWATILRESSVGD